MSRHAKTDPEADADGTLTLTEPGPGSAATPPTGALDGARFVPGTVLAERYRIVGLLGRGGMGEVYRAEDLKLGAAVALKFLPAELSLDGAALARFHREVRVARQIAHRNVCRVFDIGEAGGLHFLSMEYIDGEDLSGLLNRIGRLPRDKAVELARQVCAGLGAAHEAGVLHRDIKPANIMVDGKGRAKITDFGLAQVAGELNQATFAGTPAYMAPEQLTSGEVSVKTDLYALGLVMYEMFTGERASPQRGMKNGAPPRPAAGRERPASHVRGLHRLVEAVIMRCLEQQPAARPSSALEVAAALLGGDPLAAALAAGETPSPEMVAAAPRKGLLRPAQAAGLLAGVALMVAAGLWARQQVAVSSLARLPKSPAVLEDRARTLLDDLGYREEPADSAWGWLLNVEYIRYLRREGTVDDVARLADNRPPPYWFWYRQSPQSLRPWLSGHWRTGLDDPPDVTPGMAAVVLDPQGRLAGLRVVPPRREAAYDRPPPDWTRLFAAAGLDPVEFSPAEPRWTPPTHTHGRRAWRGSYPGRPAIPIHVEAAHHRGLPVTFDVLAPWDRPVGEVSRSEGHRVVLIMVGVFCLAACTFGAWLVRRHLRDGRGDRRGASRLALFSIVCWLLSWALGAHHFADVAEIGFFVYAIAGALVWAAFSWVLYIAFEPLLRRRWPDGIIGWSRLLAGDFRDPLVGKEVLIGSLLGAAGAALGFVAGEVARGCGQAALFADENWHPFFHGFRATLAELIGFQISDALASGAGGIFIFILLYSLPRRKWLATAVYFIALSLFLKAVYGVILPGLPLVVPLMLAALATLATARFGVLTLMVFWFNFYLLLNMPTTTDLSSWHAQSTVIAAGLTMALGAWGYRTAVGGEQAPGSSRRLV